MLSSPEGATHVTHSYRITNARPHDVALLADIERAAAMLLVDHVPASILDEATSEHELQEAQAEGRLWVALADDTPAGFAHATVLGGVAHLAEIDVHPEHGRRGLGARLVAAVCDWAASSGYAEVTLTTFRDVRWNMPFYARLGFEEIPTRELSADLVAVIEDETRRGLDPARRVAMRRRSMV